MCTYITNINPNLISNHSDVFFLGIHPTEMGTNVILLSQKGSVSLWMSPSLNINRTFQNLKFRTRTWANIKIGIVSPFKTLSPYHQYPSPILINLNLNLCQHMTQVCLTRASTYSVHSSPYLVHHSSWGNNLISITRNYVFILGEGNPMTKWSNTDPSTFKLIQVWIF